MIKYYRSLDLNGRTIAEDIARKSSPEVDLSVSLFDLSNGLEDLKKNHIESFSAEER